MTQRSKKLNWGKRVMALVLSIAFLLALVPPTVSRAATEPEQILASMTTEEKICQMMMVSPRYYLDDQGKKQGVTVLPEYQAQFLTDHSFGGVILFGNNSEDTEQIMRLIDSIQKANAAGGAASQLLVGIDQEGGDVSRLNECVQGPGNMALTATGEDADVTKMYEIIGTELTALGINVDFCPDADVNNNPANPIVGTRSFSDDPEIVSHKLKLSMEALQETDVISCPKHFPGHGDTGEDSHTKLPRIDKSYEEIQKLELLPFQTGVDQGAELIMTAHIQYPQIETETYSSILDGEEVHLPATLSETIVTDILRKDMGFDGVVITDALDMDAITKHFAPLDAMEMAIRAGVDILLIPGDMTTVDSMNALAANITALAEKTDADAELAAKVDAAVLRILKLKEKHNLLGAYDGSDIEERIADAKKVVSTRANHEIEWDITKRSITMVKNEDQTLPLIRENEKTVLLSAYSDEPLPMEYAVDLLRQDGKLPEGSTYEVHCYQGKTASESRQEVLEWIEGADNVVAISEMGSSGFLTGNSAGLLDELIEKTHAQGGKFVLLSVSLPYDVARFQEADAILITYGARSMNMDPREDTEPMKRYGPNIAAGVYMALQEEDKPEGKLPVNLPKLNAEGDGYSDEILYARGTGLTYETSEPDPDPEPEKKYTNEWVKGRWYNKNGTQTYRGIGHWLNKRKGWWFIDTLCWHPADTWQKIDGRWYFFHKDGYVARSEFVKGWWIGSNYIQSDPVRCSWHKTARGWWYGVKGGWYAKGKSYTIDGVKYTFDAKGYVIGY